MAAAEPLEFAPPPPAGTLRAFGFAIGAHLVLAAALGMNWKGTFVSTPIAVRAELWPGPAMRDSSQRAPRAAAPSRVQPRAVQQEPRAPRAADLPAAQESRPEPPAKEAARQEDPPPAPPEAMKPGDPLAIAAAEAALQHCEAAATGHLRWGAPLPGGLRILDPAEPPHSTDIANWDGNPFGYTMAVPLAAVNRAEAPAYQRPPECMVERLPADPGAAGNAAAGVASLLITARGFAPTVPDDPLRGRPNGPEVWLQASVEVELGPPTAGAAQPASGAAAGARPR